MNSDVKNFSEVMLNTFANIEKSTLERNNKFYASWKSIITKLKRSGDEQFGQKLYDHSSIVDVKNGTLLVETDHPGWSQMMQFYTKWILNGLKMYVPEMHITSIAFRVRGSDATLVSVDYKDQLKSENEKMNKKIQNEENILKKYENSDDKKNTSDTELPDSLQSMFKSMKESMLTKNKNN